MISTSNLEKKEYNSEKQIKIHTTINNKKILAIILNSSCIPLHINYNGNISKFHHIYPVINSKSDVDFIVKYQKLSNIFLDKNSIKNLTFSTKYKDSLFTIYPDVTIVLLKAKDGSKNIFLLNYYYDKKWFTSLFPFCTPMNSLYVNKVELKKILDQYSYISKYDNQEHIIELELKREISKNYIILNGYNKFLNSDPKYNKYNNKIVNFSTLALNNIILPKSSSSTNNINKILFTSNNNEDLYDELEKTDTNTTDSFYDLYESNQLNNNEIIHISSLN